MSTIAPDQLFVIACPVCRGHAAANGTMCGRDACCPFCAGVFHVPTLTLAGPLAPPSSSPPGPAEDWGNVIEKLAPPATPPTPGPAAEELSEFELAPETAEEQVVTPAAPPVAKPSPTVVSDAAADLADPAASTGPVSTETPLSPSADWIDEVLASPSPDELHGIPAGSDGVPYLGRELLKPTDQDLDFREPVRTVRRGDTVIEIRRLTPEERQARRFRRNLMMIVIGVSILLAIVLIFGFPDKPTR